MKCEVIKLKISTVVDGTLYISSFERIDDNTTRMYLANVPSPIWLVAENIVLAASSKNIQAMVEKLT